MTKDTRERFTLRMPRELLEILQAEATQKGVSLNSFIVHILWNYLENVDKI